MREGGSRKRRQRSRGKLAALAVNDSLGCSEDAARRPSEFWLQTQTLKPQKLNDASCTLKSEPCTLSP